MNKKNISFILISLGICIALTTSVIFRNYYPSRNAYEKFILKKAGKLTGRAEETPKADNPEWAAFQDYVMTMDPAEKRVPKSRLYSAYQLVKESTKNNYYRAGEYSISWHELPADMGGRSRSLLFDPNDTEHKKVWVGSVTGGLWFNNDISDSNSFWHPVNDFWPGLSVSCLAADPKSPQHLFAGTGEAETARIIYRESSARGMGIWKSTDDGAHWNLLSSTKDFAYITDLSFRVENDTSVLFAAVVSGVYMGANHSSKPSDGLYRSKDGGNSWEQVLPLIPGKSKPFAPSDIEITAQGRILVGTMKNLDGEGGACILYSDAGTQGSWTIMDNYQKEILQAFDYTVPGRVKLASSPSKPDIVYAIIGSGYITSEGFNYSYGNYFIKSGNGGKTWTKATVPPVVNNRRWASLSWHAFSIAVHPTNSQRVFIAGLDLYRTTDAGQNWARLSDWAGMYNPDNSDYVHADIHHIEFRPGYSETLLATTDGGIFYTDQSSVTQPVFQERNKNYNTLQYYSCDLYPARDSAYYIGGLQDNGSLLYDTNRANVYNMTSGGDGAFCFFDRNEPGLFFTSVYFNRYYVFNNWQYIKYIGNYYSGTFINPIDYDYKNNTIYGNACGFGGDKADQLLRISGISGSPVGNYLNLKTGTQVPFSHVRVSPFSTTTNTVLFVGTQSGKLYKVQQAEDLPVATEIGSASFPTANISCITLGQSEDTLLVSFSNYGVSSVWLTIDGGKNWVEKESNLPDIPIRWVLLHPKNSNQALLATELGVWSTTNLLKEGTTWEIMNQGLANVRVDMLQIREQDMTVVAATHGRGLFTTHYALASQVLSVGFSASATELWPGDSIRYFDHTLGKPVQWNWYFEGASPAFSTLQNPANIHYDSTGQFAVKLVVWDSSGKADSVEKVNYILVKPSSVEPIAADANMQAYPIPASDYLHIIIGIKGNYRVNLYDLKGQNVYAGNMNSESKIKLSSFKPGLYILSVTSGQQRFVRKVLVE